tara:strand:- start:646 stop:831 length:186 start_codon:yes stop_codon:yes gene_type:complete
MTDTLVQRLLHNFKHKLPTWTIQGEAADMIKGQAKIIEDLRWDIDSRDRTIRKLRDKEKAQ